MALLKIETLTCEYRSNPLGIDIKRPRISWKIQSDLRGTMQKAYQLQVTANDQDFTTTIWDTGVIQSDESIHIEYGGPELKTRTRYFYRVKIWDNYDRESPWSETAWWETGLLTSDWQAEWITPDPAGIDRPDAPGVVRQRDVSHPDRTVHRARQADPGRSGPGNHPGRSV